MINKRLLKAFPQAFTSIKKNVFFQWLALLASCASTFALVGIMNALLHGRSPWVCLVIMAICLLLRLLFSTEAENASQNSSENVKMQMRDLLYDKLTKLDRTSRMKWSSAQISQLTSEGVEQLETYFAQYIPQLFYALLAPVTLFVIVCFFSWKAALILLICVPLIPMAIIAVQKFAKRLLSRYWDQYTGLSDGFLENLNGLTTLKLYGTDDLQHQKMNVQAENFRKITMRVLIMQLNSISVMDLVAYGGSAAGILVALYGWMHGSLSLYGLTAIILLSVEFFLPMRTLGSYFHISMNGSAAADKMFAILDEPERNRRDALTDTPQPVVAENLKFAYEPGKYALEDVSFILPEKGLSGIVGESGSGKSTLASLIDGRLAGYEGSLKIGEHELKDLTRDSLIEEISVLNSAPVLFAGTVRENLKQAAPSASDEKLIEVLKKTQIWKDLKERGGLDFVVAEEGKNLSGGQKQRIAFARLLLRDAKTIILDEATSSVDAETEKVLVSLIEDLARDHQVIFITHRLANVKNANTILVLKEGELVETGEENTLLSNNKEYKWLYNAQKELEEYAKGDESDEENED